MQVLDVAGLDAALSGNTLGPQAHFVLRFFAAEKDNRRRELREKYRQQHHAK
jgi:hypothetical protein